MQEKTIEDLVYHLNKIKDKGLPKPIVLIGAGCSQTAGIPTASKIVEEMWEEHCKNPAVKRLDKDTVTYAQFMAAIGPTDRKEIFKHYIKEAKINVTHIYLAQLVSLGFIDYILTVNFDDLVQKALALYNIIPATYDISNFEGYSTTTLETQSVTYLHGNHFGIWQLNTPDELNKVRKLAGVVFNKITNNRPWIVIGYSGQDPILDQLSAFDRFDNGLYWVGYKDNEPAKNVQEKLLNISTKECFYIRDYEADSFFLELNGALQNPEPEILVKPFTFLSNVLGKIKDIEGEETYKATKERHENSKKLTQDAIGRYEEKAPGHPILSEGEIDKVKLENELINSLMKDRFDRLDDLVPQVLKSNDLHLKSSLSDCFTNWAVSIGDSATTKSGEEAENLYQESFEKLEQAIGFNPASHLAWYNWGVYIGNLATIKSGKESDDLFKLSNEKIEKAIEIKTDYSLAWNMWGTNLTRLAATQPDREAELLQRESFSKFSKAVEINPRLADAWYNWGTALIGFAKSRPGQQSEEMLADSFKKLAKTVGIRPDHQLAWDNWASGLLDYSRMLSGFREEELLSEAYEKALKAIEFGASHYNLACCLARQGRLAEALNTLSELLEKKEITFQHVEADLDWDGLRNHPKYLELSTKHKID